MYYNQTDFFAHLQHLYQLLEAQQQRLEELNLTVDELEAEMNMLKQQNNSARVERIEYKFDQLKVERLEGTLNIGITPNGGVQSGSIEDFSVDQNKMNVPSIVQQHPSLYENIQQEIYKYLNEDCYREIEMIEKQHNYQLDPNYRTFIVDNVRKQIDKRIDYYLTQVKKHDNSEEALRNVQQATVSKVKEDIHNTFVEFFKHFPMKGE